MRMADALQARKPRRKSRIRHGEPIPLWLRATGVVVALYLVLPTLFVIPMSWSEATTFVFPPRGFTFRLYENFFTDPRWIDSLGRSILVATLAAALATCVGTAAALGLGRLSGPVVGYLRAILMVPIVTPAIVLATSVYMSFLMWGLVGTLTGYVLAHAAIATPFVVVSVTSALGTFDRRLLRAAASLGASPLRAFATVTLPLISRGVAAGAVLAFVTSFDEVVIALFIRAPDFQTLPVQMYNSVTVEIDPTVAASSSLIVTTVSIVLLVGMAVGFTRRRSEKP